MRLDIPALEAFGARIQIPSRDFGLIPFHMWGPQRHTVREIDRGLRDGVHEFVELKGCRQIGGTAMIDVLTTWWHQENPGTQGVLVSDEDDNRDYRRDVLLEMNASLPIELRVPMRKNNANLCGWDQITVNGRKLGGSRLSFKAVGTRVKSAFGRSRGYNYLQADEVGDWNDPRAIAALRAALSETHPLRLYTWNSTARGKHNPFHELWLTAGKVPTQRQIFISWWMHALFVLARPAKGCEKVTRDLWGAYATSEPTEDEALWIREVKRRYHHAISAAQLGWFRKTLEDKMGGDETMLMQEYGPLPEECFQSFGLKFFPAGLLRDMRLRLRPVPRGYQYRFRDTLEQTEILECERDDATLLIWDDPEPDGVYVVSGHPTGSSTPDATDYIAQVWRVWPDRIVQVAEYASERGSTYQFAWVLLHLCGAYRTQFLPSYRIVDVGITGQRVLKEIQLVERLGYGISATHPERLKIQSFLGSVSRYFYSKPDVLSSRGVTVDWKTTPDNRADILHGLRDAIERGHMSIRSEALLDELADIRQGEAGDKDEIAGGGKSSDARVACAAIAVECWLKAALPDIINLIAPKEVSASDPASSEERLVMNFMKRLRTGGGTR